MSLPLNLDMNRVLLNLCPVLDGRAHPVEVRPNYLWCLECETGWKIRGGTLEAWMLDIDVAHTHNLKIQIKKLVP